MRRKAEDLDDNKPSKHQIKKEKRAERKKNKKHKALASNTIIFKQDGTFVSKSDSESDADVEDNADVIKNNFFYSFIVISRTFFSGPCIKSCST